MVALFSLLNAREVVEGERRRVGEASQLLRTEEAHPLVNHLFVSNTE
jgi:hypothetical protein